MTMTEDIVNEICEAGIELFPNENKFFIIHNRISGATDEESGFYPCGEKIKLIDTELSIETQSFLCDVDWLNKNIGLLMSLLKYLFIAITPNLSLIHH